MKTLATRLQWARAESGMSQQELADRSGVAQSTIGSLESGARKTARKIAIIAHELNVNALWLADGKGQPKESIEPKNFENNVEDAPSIIAPLKKLPVVGRVQAGPDGLLHIDDYPSGHGDGYMLWWSTCANAYALRIRGESMSPRYRPGEFVGVDPCADVNPNDEVIVLFKNEQRMIKRLLWRRDSQICLESVNQEFKNIIVDIEDINQLHLVLGNIPKAAFRNS